MAFRVPQILVLEAIELEERREEARIARRMVRDAQDPFRLAEPEFKANFRLSKEACLYVANSISPHMQAGQYGNRIPVLLRILCAINFFAVGSYQRNVGNSLWACMSQPMVSRAIKDVSNNIVRHLLTRWIQFPRNDEERELNKNRFRVTHGMREIVGVVDGSHIAIVKPVVNEHVYVNRKGYHSINVQIVCDDRLSIISVIARWPGSTHDAFIWRNSRIAQAMRANYENGDRGTKMMGDSGYPCLPWLLVPLPNPGNQSEVQFNNTFKRTRCSVERCIGVLKGRFRCLLKDRTLHYSPENAGRIILTCAVLHNIAIHHRDENSQPMYDEIDLEMPVAEPAAAAYDAMYRQLGQAARRQYINQYF